MAGKNFLWVLAALFTFVIAGVAAVRKDPRNAEAEIIKLLLNPERYDKRIRPPGDNTTNVTLFDQPQKVTGDPVIVKVNAFIRSVGQIDDRNKEYRVSMTLRQNWNDKRLKFSPHDDLKYILLTSDEDIWSPDLFFSNEKEGHIHELLHRNSLVRISPEGDVLYSTRVSLKLSCPMDLTNFPMDKQTCFIRMASYAYTTNDLIFLWKDDDPVQSVVDLDMSPFVMQGFGIDYCNSKTSTGEYSCLRTEFLFKRLVHNYILHLYLPLGLLVASSWAPFWLDFYGEDGAPVLGVVGRCLIALLCLLATIIEAARVSTYAPPSSGDARAIDSWTTWCQTFVALVLLEVIIVAVIDRWRRERHRNAAAAEGAGRSPTSADGGEAGEAKGGPQPNLLKKWLMGWPTAGQRIDVICRIIFPVVFIIFNITYWSTYADYMGLRSLSSIKKIPY
ncbi:glutamate-gated chloride channel-like [Hetaerina americana]|uniref:glutamate-gated chloride channel-like n=1 Tax=Hetaerina americana TaxID=62018 RepID=UPI003A7F527C